MAGEIAAEPPLLAHRAEVVFDTAAHTVRITDEVLVPGGLGHLRLGADFQVTGLAIAGQAVADLAAVLSQHTDEDGDYQQMDLAAAGLTDGGTLQLVYDGTFFESTDDVVFSRENVGGEITATISQEGIYLSGAAEWLVWHEEAMAMFDIRIDTPAGFETVTQGTRTEHAAAGDRLLTPLGGGLPVGRPEPDRQPLSRARRAGARGASPATPSCWRTISACARPTWNGPRPTSPCTRR